MESYDELKTSRDALRQQVEELNGLMDDKLTRFISEHIRAHLREIIDVSDEARRDPRMKGHHCDMRKALDSIYDRANLNAESLAACWKQYRLSQPFRPQGNATQPR